MQRAPSLVVVACALVGAFAAAFACNVVRKPGGSQLESVQSIHHGGTVLLWWSPDADKFFVKSCANAVPADLKIETIEQMNAACPGDTPAKETTRAALTSMLVEIASEDVGFDSILRDATKRAQIAQITSEISDGQWEEDDVKTALESLEGQMKDLVLNLEKTKKDIAKMDNIAAAAAASNGQPAATETDFETIFGPAYKDAKAALKALEEGQTKTKADVEKQLAAYDVLKKKIEASQSTLKTVATTILDKIAKKDQLFTVSLLQTENFDFALLQSAAIRLNLMTSHFPNFVTCPQACTVGAPYYDEARCYSCRCKEAFGGSLPGPDEINCKNAKQIVNYKVKLGDAAGPDFEALTADAESCLNPALLGGACEYGSRLGQLTKGDVHYKWICRHRSDPTAPEATYGDFGIIGTNMATGASCWWDDLGGEITDTKIPKIDLTNATAQEVDYFKQVFYNTTGEGCTGCHDNDPFMYSPFLRSVEWETLPYVDAKYSTVQYDGSLRPVEHSFLVSDAAAECTSCHRLASASTCASWAKQSFGVSKGWGHEPTVENALDQVGEGGVRKAGENWQVAYWMPPTKGFYKGTFEKWHQKNGPAKDHILKCCADPAAAECKWVDGNGNPVATTTMDTLPPPPPGN